MCRCRGALYVLVPVTSKTEDARIQIQKPEKLTAQGQLLEALYIHPSFTYFLYLTVMDCCSGQLQRVTGKATCTVWVHAEFLSVLVCMASYVQIYVFYKSVCVHVDGE